MLEIDISKYDKSQGLAALIFDCMLMDKVGVDGFTLICGIMLTRIRHWSTRKTV